ncbi:MAG: nitrogen regulation protein NR(I), partial [Alphaproteobacteria bacterium]|nr:nitrogen regulation protein NR(I) [Alphaproteobacteria bacterium]
RLPPLRERTEDIPDLVRHFLNQAQEQGLPAKTIRADGIARLQRYRWPGNVRELENLIRRLAALYSETDIGVEIINTELADADMTDFQSGLGPESLGDAVERHLRDYFDAHDDDLPTSGLYERILKEVERPLITLCLTATRGNQIKAAEVLGLNRNTLRKKIRNLDIEVVRSGKQAGGIGE